MTQPKNPYDEARKALEKLHEDRLKELKEQQEKTRYERAERDAQAERAAMPPPRPGWHPPVQPDLPQLIRKHERKYEVADARQQQRLSAELDQHLQKVDEMQRSGEGWNLSGMEVAVKALPSRAAPDRQRPAYPSPTAELNRQGANGLGIDVLLIQFEQKGELARVARERAAAQNLEVAATQRPSRPDDASLDLDQSAPREPPPAQPGRPKTPEQQQRYDQVLKEMQERERARVLELERSRGPRGL